MPPNTTHILQPADVSVFKPFKHYWRDEVIKFQRQNPNAVVRRKDAAPLIEKVLKRVTPSSIINGFRCTGLYPLNPDAVDYRKCLTSEENSSSDEAIVQTRNSFEGEERNKFLSALNVIEEEIGIDNLKTYMAESNGNDLFKKLYKGLRNKAGLPNEGAEEEATEIVFDLDSIEVVPISEVESYESAAESSVLDAG